VTSSLSSSSLPVPPRAGVPSSNSSSMPALPSAAPAAPFTRSPSTPSYPVPVPVLPSVPAPTPGSSVASPLSPHSSSHAGGPPPVAPRTGGLKKLPPPPPAASAKTQLTQNPPPTGAPAPPSQGSFNPGTLLTVLCLPHALLLLFPCLLAIHVKVLQSRRPRTDRNSRDQGPGRHQVRTTPCHRRVVIAVVISRVSFTCCF
jgi:hypothetical protein